ncbi:hypothetical protein [Sphingopyxis sp. NJF-3]
MLTAFIETDRRFHRGRRKP